jgi:UDP-glucose 4-epimerase
MTPKNFITGAAGFIGSTLTDALLDAGEEVTGYDNLSTGREIFLSEALKNSKFTFIRGDVLDPFALQSAMRGSHTVWHLSANADVRFGLNHPRRDLEQNTVATSNVLEAMRHNGIRDILFSSTASVYGEAAVFPTPEDAPFPVQTSLYASSKLAGEALISSYAEGFKFRGVVFRFVSILGERYTHGHVFDFVKKLVTDPGRLPVLGDGSQRKSYLYAGDCVKAMLLARAKLVDGELPSFSIFNLGAEEYCSVIDSVKWITGYLKVDPVLEFSGGSRGWVGDNPFIFLDTSKIRALGWKNDLNIKEAVERTAAWLLENRWILG